MSHATATKPEALWSPSIPDTQKGGRWRRLVANLIALTAGVVISALLLEVLVLAIFGEQPKFPRHVVGAPFGVRINQPNAVYRHKSADVNIWMHINSRGMRGDRDFTYAKPAGTTRVVVLGDSFTMGYEVDANQTYASVLEQELRARGINAEVMNTGVSGYGTTEEYLYLKRELLKYSPDLVVVGFYGNDLVDNVRTNLFKLDGTRLVPDQENYVPAGRTADFLNQNWFFNLLSERSNAFVLVKERATEALKERIVTDNVKNLRDAGERKRGEEVQNAYDRRLTAAVFEQFYGLTREHNIPMAVLSIPFYGPLVGAGNKLIETFPEDLYPTDRPGFAFVPAKPLLEPYFGREPLYYLRSHGHWTPLSHKLAGKALAEAVMSKGMLKKTS